MQYLGAISKTTEWSWSISKEDYQQHSNQSLCLNHWLQRSWSRPVLWRLKTPSEITPKKDVLFITGGWESKVRSQEILTITGKCRLGVQNTARQKLTEFVKRTWWPYKHIFPKIQELTLHMDITRWAIPKSGWLCSLQPEMEELYTVSKNKTWSWLWLRSWALYFKILA